MKKAGIMLIAASILVGMPSACWVAQLLGGDVDPVLVWFYWGFPIAAVGAIVAAVGAVLDWFSGRQK